jgi:uncharacterized protein (UPF0332 family)
MSCPKSFFSLAQTLSDTDICEGEENKVKFCTIVNRSYYAVFLRVRYILETQYGEKPGKQGEHYRVRHSLVNTMGEAELFQTFKTLWNERIKADYASDKIGAETEHFERFANGSLFSAEYLLNELEKY